MTKVDKKRCASRIHKICVLALLCTAAQADQQGEYKKAIANIAQEIKQISRNMNANKALLKTEEDKLAELEQKIHDANQQLKATKAKLKDQEALNARLDEQIQALNLSKAEDKRALARLVKEKYISGETNYLKLLLNQENPYAVGRLANYYDYFAKAQMAKLSEVRATLAELEQLAQSKLSNLAEIRARQKRLETQQLALNTAQGKRQQTVQRLNQKVSRTNEQLAQLNKDRSRLNNLLEAIALQAEKLRKLEQQRAAEQPGAMDRPTQVSRPLVKGGFIKQRGRLRYPVNGRTKYGYGSRIVESGMRAQGMFFETDGGQPIKSIFRGRVLFADYLKGYGLLLIVDHGDDHISLYGHNELLYKNVGDTVNTNEVIAKSGVSGGLKSHGLYFEIRKSATPVDPAKWCY